MSLFLKHIRETGFLQHLRSQIPQRDLEAFDKMVKEKLTEYDNIWIELEPSLTKFNQGANDGGSNEPESQSKSGLDKKSDNRES